MKKEDIILEQLFKQVGVLYQNITKLNNNEKIVDISDIIKNELKLDENIKDISSPISTTSNNILKIKSNVIKNDLNKLLIEDKKTSRMFNSFNMWLKDDYSDIKSKRKNFLKSKREDFKLFFANMIAGSQVNEKGESKQEHEKGIFDYVKDVLAGTGTISPGAYLTKKIKGKISNKLMHRRVRKARAARKAGKISKPGRLKKIGGAIKKRISNVTKGTSNIIRKIGSKLPSRKIITSIARGTATQFVKVATKTAVKFIAKVGLKSLPIIGNALMLYDVGETLVDAYKHKHDAETVDPRIITKQVLIDIKKEMRSISNEDLSGIFNIKQDSDKMFVDTTASKIIDNIMKIDMGSSAKRIYGTIDNHKATVRDKNSGKDITVDVYFDNKMVESRLRIILGEVLPDFINRTLDKIRSNDKTYRDDWEKVKQQVRDDLIEDLETSKGEKLNKSEKQVLDDIIDPIFNKILGEIISKSTTEAISETANFIKKLAASTGDNLTKFKPNWSNKTNSVVKKGKTVIESSSAIKQLNNFNARDIVKQYKNWEELIILRYYDIGFNKSQRLFEVDKSFNKWFNEIKKNTKDIKTLNYIKNYYYKSFYDSLSERDINALSISGLVYSLSGSNVLESAKNKIKGWTGVKSGSKKSTSSESMRSFVAATSGGKYDISGFDGPNSDKMLMMNDTLLTQLVKLSKDEEVKKLLDGKPLYVTQSVRTIDDQIGLWNKYGPKQAAFPGTSPHESGFGIDINALQLDTIGDKLLDKHKLRRPLNDPEEAKKLGMVQEPWHVELKNSDGKSKPQLIKKYGKDLVNKAYELGSYYKDIYRKTGTWPKLNSSTFNDLISEFKLSDLKTTNTSEGNKKFFDINKLKIDKKNIEVQESEVIETEQVVEDNQYNLVDLENNNYNDIVSIEIYDPTVK
jgi:hypothetical protein